MNILAYFPKAGLCNLSVCVCVCVCVLPSPIAARQGVFDETRDRPFSVGALTERNRGPRPPHPSD
jgi:hypothetical protein